VFVRVGPSPTAGVRSFDGEVSVLHADGSSEPVTLATRLRKDDQISTGVDSHAVLTFADGSRFEMNEMTQIIVAELLVKASRQNVTVQLKLGEVAAQVNPNKAFQTNFKLTIPTEGTAGVRGTVFRVFYDPVARAGIVATLVHKVAFTPSRRGARTILVPAGKEIEVTASGVSRLAPIGKADAYGGIDREKARDLVIAVIDGVSARCQLTAVQAGVGVQPAGALAWMVTVPVQGKATGTSSWRVAAGKATPLNATAQQLAAGCP
jgi:hypothetical protein